MSKNIKNDIIKYNTTNKIPLNNLNNGKITNDFQNNENKGYIIYTQEKN